ncbi:MAG TPA: nickel pincer cofactor biosynthesis protein LarC [Verrucomicrobiae bacterium]|nr:nickel pincer cofactor biosynthesis protein LarC [Verrucomicrobiae bacterium]
MKTLYLDIFSGISGDMFIAALIDVGVDAAVLETELKKLSLGGYHLHVGRKQKSGIEGVKFDVHLTDAHDHEHSDDGHHHEHGPSHEHPHSHVHGQPDARSILTANFRPGNASQPESHQPHTHEHSRDFTAIRQLIDGSGLSPWVKEKSIGVFRRIAVAEGKIHGMPPEQVHFHEVGAVDSIVDIVGAAIGLELLGKPRVLAGPVIEGTGFVMCAHGRFPIPAPATLAILGARGIPITQCDEPQELITPTGAALLAELVESFGPMQNLVAERIGFGLGTRDNRSRPNVVRAVLGSIAAHSTAAGAGTHDWETDTVAVLETNLDDISAEILGHFVENAMNAGALDVFYTAIQMKKNRPAVLLRVICMEGQADRFSELILRETSAFGVRRQTSERRKLQREFQTVDTPYGRVDVKLGKLDGEIIQVSPEFESCRRAAEQGGVPVKHVFEAAIREAHPRAPL